MKLNMLFVALTLSITFIMPFKVQGQTADVLIQEGIENYWRGENEAAMTSFNQVLETDEDNLLALSYRGATFRILQDYDRALDDFNRILELDPDYALAYSLRGRLYAELNNETEAVRDVERAVDLDDSQALYYYNRGRVYFVFRADETDQIVEDFRRAVELDPGEIPQQTRDYLGFLGSALLTIDEYSEAVEAMSASLAIDPNSYYVLADRGYAYSRLGETNEALADFAAAALLEREETYPREQGSIVLENMYMLTSADVGFNYRQEEVTYSYSQNVTRPYNTRFGFGNCPDIGLQSPLIGGVDFFGGDGTDSASISVTVYYALSAEVAQSDYEYLVETFSDCRDRTTNVRSVRSTSTIGDETSIFLLNVPYLYTTTMFGVPMATQTRYMDGAMVVFSEDNFIVVVTHGATMLFWDVQATALDAARSALNRLQTGIRNG